MYQLNGNQTYDYEKSESRGKELYRLGGIAALMAVIGTLLDIIITFIPGWGTSTVPITAMDLYAQFQNNWLLGLRNLDLLNAIISMLMIPMFYALYDIHRSVVKGYASLAFILFMVGTIIFIGNNTALPMLELSSKYAEATTDSQKIIIAAAGEAMLARGEHGSYGAFIGFALSSLASISMAFVMLKGRIFRKAMAYIGIIGFVLLLIYTILATFVPHSNDLVTILAMPGGLLALGWNIMVALKLLQLSKRVHEKERG